MVLAIDYKDDSFKLIKVDGMAFCQVQEYVDEFLNIWHEDVDTVRLCHNSGEIIHTFYNCRMC